MDNELYHYGVKGMKWGVRRKSGSGSSSKPSWRKKTAAKLYANKKYAKEVHDEKERYRKEYNKGASKAGKIYNRITGLDKLMADVKYEAKVDDIKKKYRKQKPPPQYFNYL